VGAEEPAAIADTTAAFRKISVAIKIGVLYFVAKYLKMNIIKLYGIANRKIAVKSIRTFE